MENRILALPQADEAFAADSLLKVTSLLYLKDALQREHYEECAFLVQSAKSFGASSSEVSDVIASYVQKIRVGQNEASANVGRRFS